jgi:3-oxoacyl-[acyl-carrier protein] reductase
MQMIIDGRFQPFSLQEKVVIVTGGGAGIGRVYCERLAEVGASVVAADIDFVSAQACAAAIEATGGKGIAVNCDVADADSVKRMVEKCLERFGRVDGLVNNAALMSSLPRGDWHEISVSDWDRVMAVNTRGLFLCCREVWPHMKRQGGGKIVNISSNRVFDGTPNRLHYSTSKAAVIGFTRSLAREIGDDNICVNAIAPGFTASDSQIASSDEKYIRKMAAINDRKAIKRTQTPDDLVGAVLFLLSNASNYLSGQTINVDGGFVMH